MKTPHTGLNGKTETRGTVRMSVVAFITLLCYGVTGTVSAAPDVTFSNIEISALRDTSVVIQWDTDVPATGRIEYGLTAGYGNMTDAEDISYWHMMEIADLARGTSYHYRIRAKDAGGNVNVSDDYTFTTRTQAEVEAIIKAARSDGELPKVYYVKPEGDDGKDGLSLGNAWKTLSHAQDQLQPGDTLLIADGTYTNDTFVAQVSGIPEAPITIKALSGTPKFIESGTTRTLKLFEFHDWGQPGPISYYNIQGIRIENYKRALSIIRESHHMKIIDISADQCSSPFFAARGSHHLITENLHLNGSHWNSWYIWYDNHHIKAKGVQVTNHVEHSCFDLHTNNSYITICDCEADTSDDNAPGVYMGHGDYGTDDNIVITNFIYTDVPNGYMFWVWNPGDNLFIDGAYSTGGKGVEFMGAGKNLTMKNVGIRLGDSPESQDSHGLCFTSVSDIDRILLENINVENVKKQYHYDFKFESGFDVIKNVLMRNIDGDDNDYTIRAGDGAPVGYHTLEYTDGRLFSVNDAGEYTDYDFDSPGTYKIQITGSIPAGTITGTVVTTDTGLPIEGALVSAGVRSDNTNSSGIYTIENIPVGTYTVTCSKGGYETASESNVVVNKDSTTTVDFQLESDTTPPVITLKTITVNGSVDDATVTEVDINGTTVTVTAGAYSHEVDVSSTDTITIFATNDKGKTVTRTIEIK